MELVIMPFLSTIHSETAVTAIAVDATPFNCAGECSGSVSGTGTTFTFSLQIGLCEFGSCDGCIEPQACNFDNTAIFQGDSVCLYPLDLYGVDYVDCDNVCLEDDDGDGVCNLNEPVGCMASDACNFDSVAEFDDGSCEYVTCAGCTDDIACNFLPSATFDDGACDYACITGCTEPAACNYDAVNVFEDGSCEYTELYYDCYGECLQDADGDGVCDELEVLGCIDATACNYDTNATEDDGSCITLALGETCCAAGIYFSEFTEGPASDTYFEIHNASEDSVLLDAFHVGRTANQLNPAGGFDFEDIQFPNGFRLGPGDVFVVAEAAANATILAATDMTVPEISSGDDALGLIRSGDGVIVDQIGVPGTDEGLGWQIAGVPNATYNRTIRRKSAVADGNGGDWSSSAGTNADDGEWIVLSEMDLTGIEVHDQNGVCVGESPFLVRGCNSLVSCIYHPEATAHVTSMCDFGSCYGCKESQACNFDNTAIFQGDSVCLYPLDLYGVDYVDCDNVCLEDDDGDGVCNLNEPVGCMASDACNFDSVAEFDDGSCEYVTCAGCTDDIACNFLPSATFDDGCLRLRMHHGLH